MSVAFASATSSYSIQNDNLGVSDINVFFSKNITEANGNYNAWFNDSKALGHLNLFTKANDGSIDSLFVMWSSEEPGYGITINQNDDYAIKFIANAEVARNGIVKHNQQVYVHYNKLAKTFVVRGYGFRIESDL